MSTLRDIPVKIQQNPGFALLPADLVGTVTPPKSFSDNTWLWLDVPRFRVWSIIRNNYPAVRDNMRRAGADAETLDNATALYQLINTLDEEDQVQALNVPWIFGKDAAQDEAIERLKTGALGTAHQKVVPLVLGLLGLVNAAIAIDNGEQAREAAEEVARMEEAAAADAKAQRAQRWERIKPWLLPAAIVLAIIITLLIIRLRQ